MKINAIETKQIEVEVSKNQILKIISNVFKEVFDYNTLYECIIDGNICSEIKVGPDAIIRKANETDILVDFIYKTIKAKLK